MRKLTLILQWIFSEEEEKGNPICRLCGNDTIDHGSCFVGKLIDKYVLDV